MQLSFIIFLSFSLLLYNLSSTYHGGARSARSRLIMTSRGNALLRAWAILLAAGRHSSAFVAPPITTIGRSAVEALPTRHSSSPVAVSHASSSSSSSASSSSVLEGFEHRISDRLPYSPTGYSSWEWRTHHGACGGSDSGTTSTSETTSHNINYVELGDPSRPALLLVHGFGASSYHWRHNIPTLAREYHVYAIDLLGFGWSDKPIMDYDASVWKDQVVDFVREVIFSTDGDDERGGGRYVAIAGNSLGGFTAMYASSDVRIKDRVGGCILLNAAGRFRDPTTTDSEDRTEEEANSIVKYVTSALQRFVIACSFIYTKRPSRIEQILRQVYPVNDANVDDELVASIYTPALDASAAEVFYRVIAKNGSGPKVFVDDILKELHCPVLLAWGESDPWIKSAAADRMEMLHANFHSVNTGDENRARRWIRRVSIDAGHCPHDEAPGAVNDAIIAFAGEVLGVPDLKCWDWTDPHVIVKL
ncbi:hypothetical protein ACHAXA_004012 [Cyclostephanos tholiformis]|uniref:AB hydrolase-1 domain-containing protein n=1 Tax=Cyclostephanos tholiformis TaxID=382380 RepID=A0ABD3S018_9STRA